MLGYKLTMLEKMMSNLKLLLRTGNPGECKHPIRSIINAREEFTR